MGSVFTSITDVIIICSQLTAPFHSLNNIISQFHNNSSLQLVTMPYTIYPDRAASMEFVPWYDARELGATIAAIRKINFSIVEQRQQALERLGNMLDECPYDPDHRFPTGKRYVCEGYGDWARKMQQLKSALNYKPLDKDDKTRNTAPGSGPSVGHQDDPQQAFFNATTSMFDQLVRLDGVFDRASFERSFGLVWEGGDVVRGQRPGNGSYDQA